MANRYTLHVDQWKDCTRCELHKHRIYVCISRGDIPCDVLFVGEGPGESEDSIGQPLVGPAGQMLDDIIEQARCQAPTINDNGNQRVWTVCFTNTVGCIPRYEDGQKAEQPSHESIVACAPRVIELVKMCQPRLIVSVGKVAEDYLDQRYKYSIKVGPIPQVHLVHPSHILKGNIAARPLTIKRNVIVLRDAILKLSEE